MTVNGHVAADFSSSQEARRILSILRTRFGNDALSLPEAVAGKLGDVEFKSSRDLPYFPIPFKETETAAALKAIEGAVASCFMDLRAQSGQKRGITVDLEKTTAFLFQTYLSTVGGYSKLQPEAKKFLKGKDIPNFQLASDFD